MATCQVSRVAAVNRKSLSSPVAADQVFLNLWFAKAMVCMQVAFHETEKSTLWTDAGVDQNFQRDSGAIGPY